MGSEVRAACMASLSDYQSQTKARISQKLVKESVKHHGSLLPKEEVRQLIKELCGIFCNRA